MRTRLGFGVAAFVLYMNSGNVAQRESMQHQIERAASDFQGLMGVAARNLLNGEEVAVHGDTPFPTASTIKTAVMIEAYHQAAEGKLLLESRIRVAKSDKVGGPGVLNGMVEGLELTVRDLIHLMITLS